MAQEPKRKHSKARKRTRRASIVLKPMTLIECKNCKKSTLPHQVCQNCGFYKGEAIIIKSKVEVTRS